MALPASAQFKSAVRRMAWMEPRLGLLEEVRSEADVGEEEEEELWVRGCTHF